MQGEQVDNPSNRLLNIKPALLDIPDGKFKEVVQLLEAIRHQAEVREALDYVRPRIVRLRPPRPLNLQRTCYLPLEDLLVYEPQTVIEGLIPRVSMARAWNYILQRLDADLNRELSAELVKTHPRDIANVNAIGARLWPPSYEILKEAIENAPSDRQLRRQLVGENPEVMLDLMQIARLLSTAGGIQRFKGVLPPRPIGYLSKVQLESVEDVFREMGPIHFEQAYAVLLAIAVRMEVPGYLLEIAPRLIHEFSMGERNCIISKLGAFVLGDMTSRMEQTAQDQHTDIDDRALAAGSVVHSLSAAERSMRNVAPIMKKELKAVRAAAATVVTEIIGEARTTVAAALESGPSAPLEDRIQSEKSLIALRRCLRFAERLGLNSDVSATLGLVAKDMKLRAETLIDQPVGNAEDTDKKEVRRSELIWALRMLEVSGETEEAQALWRRAAPLLQTT